MPMFPSSLPVQTCVQGHIELNLANYFQEEDGYAPGDVKKRVARIHELAEYLWDNYIDLNDATHLFIIGVGEAYQAVLHLLNSRTDAFTNGVTGIINFINGDLLPASDQVIYDKPKWYRQNTLNFVSHNHLAWSIDKKKSTKRYGNLVQSPARGLNDMLMAHKEQVQGYINSRLLKGK